MAEEFKKDILIDVRLKSEEADKRGAELVLTLQRLKKEKKEAEAELAKNPGSTQAAASLSRIQTEIKGTNKELAELQRQTLLTQKAQQAGSGSVEELRAELGLTTAAYNKLSEAEQKTTARGQALADQGKSLSDQLKVLEGRIGDTRRNVGNYQEAFEAALRTNSKFEGSVAQLEQQYAELKEAIRNADPNDPRYDQARKKADDLGLHIGVLTGKLNEFGEREPKNPAKKAFEDAFQSAGALVQSIQLLTLLSGDNEDAAKLQARAIQSVAIAQGIANIARSKGEIIDTIALAKTKALTIAQRIYALAVGQSTGALKVLRITLLATGAGAVLVGIGLLAQRMGLFGKATEDAADKTDALTAASAKAADSIREEKTRLELLLAVARDETKSKERREQAVRGLNELSPKYLSNLKLETINTAEAQKAIEAYVSSLEKKAKAQALFETLVEQEKKLFEIEQERDRLRKKLVKEAKDLEGSDQDFFKEQALLLSRNQNLKAIGETYKTEKELQAGRGDLLNQLKEIDQAETDATESTTVYVSALDKLKEAETGIANQIKEALRLGKPIEDLQLKLIANRRAQTDLEYEYAKAIENVVDPLAAQEIGENLRARTITLINDGLQTQIDRENELGDLRANLIPIDHTLLNQTIALNAELQRSEEELADARIDGIQRAASALGSLASEGSKAQQILFLIQQGAAVAEVIFNTSRALTAISANLALIPAVLPPGVPNPAFPIAAGIAAAQATKVKIQAGVSIGTILAQTIKGFAKKEEGDLIDFETAKSGKLGVFGGKPHSAGGTKGVFEDGTALEVEADEVFAIINKRDSSLLRSLSRLNSRHGKSFYKDGGLIFQDGGFAGRIASASVLSRFELRQQARIMAEAMPRQVVTVEDINAKIAERAEVVNRSIL